jgi:hypothetical protein
MQHAGGRMLVGVIGLAVVAGGIDKALLTLRDQPFGEFPMLLAALGLLVFGIYGLCEARCRKV